MYDGTPPARWTAPIVYHEPGSPDGFHIQAMALARSSGRQRVEVDQGGDITVITTSTIPAGQSLVEKTAKAAGVPIHVERSKPRHWKGWDTKTRLLIRALKNTATKYAICVDAFDAAIVGPPAAAARWLDNQPAPIQAVYQFAPGPWPFMADHFLARFEHSVFGCHLCAGCLAGHVDFLTHALEVGRLRWHQLLSVTPPALWANGTRPAAYDDQAAAKLLLFAYWPAITIDKNRALFGRRFEMPKPTPKPKAKK